MLFVQARELQNKYEKQMKILRDDLELRRKQDLQETEERKNAHIRELMRKHRQAFNEIKNYYNDITSNNLDLIKTLKEDVAEMKKKEALNEKLMYEISTENKRLSEPLNRALKVFLSTVDSRNTTWFNMGTGIRSGLHRHHSLVCLWQVFLQRYTEFAGFGRW
jgi:hypothetical protein